MTKWDLPAIAIGKHNERIHGPAWADSLKAVMNEKLEECMKQGVSRDEVAHRMSGILGSKISTAMLNAYVSPSAGDKHVNVVRFMAFVEATEGFELIGWIASCFQLNVVSQKHVKLIERELLKERLKQLEADIDAADEDYRGRP